MTSTVSATSEVLNMKVLNMKDLRRLCAAPGPCITITLSAYHPGVQPSYGDRLKGAIRLAEQELAKLKDFKQINELLVPLHALVDEPDMKAGGPAMVIFRSPVVFERFYLPATVSPHVVVAPHFHVTPLLKQLSGEREFYILAVSRKHLRLLRYVNAECHEIPVPATIPHNVEEAGAFDQPDHSRRNRSSVGKSTGTMSAVPFGTGSEREKTHERIQHFFSMVDRGLGETLQDLPLLLAGVDYEVALYKRAAKYPGIMGDRLPGDPQTLTLQEIAGLAGGIADASAQLSAETALERLREKVGSGQTATDVSQILPAASEGRVAELVLAEGAELREPPEPMQDLINAAAVLTLLNGGDVLMLPAAKMGGEAPIAALYRY